MRSVPDWLIQVAWWASGIFATGAVWYFLSTKDYAPAAASAVVALMLAATAVALHRKKDALALAALPKELQPELPHDYVRRDPDTPSQVRIVETLPELKAVVYRAAQVGWSSPSTIDMIEACYDAVDFSEFAWLRVAEFYPHRHFGGTTADEYIKDYVRERYQFHRKKHEPAGPGTGGTIVGPLTGSDVVADLERLVEDSVQSIFVGQDFDFDSWRQRWRSSSTTDDEVQ